MWRRNEFEVQVERLDSVELESKPFNGWLKTNSHSDKTFKLFGFLNNFKKKEKVRQMELSVRQMIGSAYTGLCIAGIDIGNRFGKSGIKRILFNVWRYTILALLILFNITSVLSICLSNNGLHLIIDLIRIVAVLYRFVVLNNQKTKLEYFVNKIENSLEKFPNVKLAEYDYSKLVTFVVFYSCAQGQYC